MKAKKMTPLMEQYWSIKNQHQDKVLLFRMGDFFEMFDQDAVVAAPILNIALTVRNKKSGDETPMCGMPHHSIATPIAKLLQAGHRVAICDQVEDPKEAKGLVKRAVTRILSPGMVYDPETLNQLESNFTSSYDESHVAFIESTTGEAFYYQVKNQSERERLLFLLSPTEIVLSSENKRARLLDNKSLKVEALVSSYESLEQEIDNENSLPESCLRLLSYWQYMNGGEPHVNFRGFVAKTMTHNMELAPNTIRHLEVFRNQKGGTQGTVFSALNRTKTAMGARQLKQWIQFPLLEKKLIEKRHREVTRWMSDVDRLKGLRSLLGRVGDLERKIGKLTNPNCNPRDLVALADAFRAGLEMEKEYSLVSETSCLEAARKVVEWVDRAIVDEPPAQFKKGAFIRFGFHSELDELIDVDENGQRLLVELEGRERESTQIPNLKVRYNNVFGYFIEVTKTHSSKVPKHYVRKQTLTNAERYITDELNQLEQKILSAQSKRIVLEMALFHQLRKEILSHQMDLYLLCGVWSEVDVLSGFSWLAIEENYVCPSLVTDGAVKLFGSRHPVVEQVMSGFVSNDIHLKRGENVLITGPNMAGKSTLMRQVALAALYTQIGCFVPASEAQMPLFDQVFTRVGASDSLIEGLSTFMVEMTETADILKSATRHSLVILDEIGRGTSTYDGMSLAQAILEYMVSTIGCTTLFATHYHELTSMEQRLPLVRNVHMGISNEKRKELKFLYTLCSGPANRSYGVEVAKLAGLPPLVTSRAAKVLQKLEAFGCAGEEGQMSLSSLMETQEVEESVLDPKVEEVVRRIEQLSVPTLTPLQALNFVAELKSELSH